MRAFACSERFRLNANGRRVDVWLIYRCVACEATWNRKIFARSDARRIGAELYDRMLHIDRATAWRYACDVEAASRGGMRIDGDVPAQIERDAAIERPERIVIRAEHPLSIRLDRLLAEGLGISRSALARMAGHGAVEVRPPRNAALRGAARDGQEIKLDWGRRCTPTLGCTQ